MFRRVFQLLAFWVAAFALLLSAPARAGQHPLGRAAQPAAPALSAFSFEENRVKGEKAEVANYTYRAPLVAPRLHLGKVPALSTYAVAPSKLTYFGKRYLVPQTGRWLSPDPLALHVPGKADLNLYAYVRGRVFTSVDPFGLADETRRDSQQSSSVQDQRQMSSVQGNAVDEINSENQQGQALLRDSSLAKPVVTGQVLVAQVRYASNFPNTIQRLAAGNTTVNTKEYFEREARDNAAMPQGASTLVPVLGSARDGVQRLQQGRYAQALGDFALAISDFGAVKAIGVGAVKVGGFALGSVVFREGVAGGKLAAGGIAPSARALGQALEAAGHLRPASSAAHHIVAGGAEAAAPARAALKRFGIGINDAANGVFLPANSAAPNLAGAAVHSTVHTSAYYQAVNEALAQARTSAEALEVLRTLRQGLLEGGL